MSNNPPPEAEVVAVCASQSLFVPPKACVLVSLELVCHCNCVQLIHSQNTQYRGKSLNLRNHFAHDYVRVCTYQECLQFMATFNPFLFEEVIIGFEGMY